MLEKKWPAAEAAVMYATWSREVAERQAANAVKQAPKAGDAQ